MKIRRFTGHVVFCLLCLTGLVIALVIGASQNKGRISKKISSRQQVVAAKSAEGRKIYPLSVISGGAYSADELDRARRLDSVVRAHYANFGRNPVARQAPSDLFVYVSYRKSNAVYWTRTKRRISKGELVLSDGKSLARARCGNRLSFTPEQPTSPEREPTEETFNTPETPEISIPLDAPPPSATEADLYVPADLLPVGLLSTLPSPSPFADSQSATSPGVGGGYLPVPGWATGSLGGGIPFWVGGIVPPVRTNAGSGTSPAGPIVIGNLVAVNTPEPESAKLLFLAIPILTFFCLRGRIHLSR